MFKYDHRVRHILAPHQSFEDDIPWIFPVAQV